MCTCIQCRVETGENCFNVWIRFIFSSRAPWLWLVCGWCSQCVWLIMLMEPVDLKRQTVSATSSCCRVVLYSAKLRSLSSHHCAFNSFVFHCYCTVLMYVSILLVFCHYKTFTEKIKEEFPQLYVYLESLAHSETQLKAFLETNYSLASFYHQLSC